MYRVTKALNHNAVLALDSEGCQEYLLMGKGIGFGKKVSQRIEAEEGTTVYSLRAVSEKGTARELLKELKPEFLEIAEAVLKAAEAEFGEIDYTVLFPSGRSSGFCSQTVEKRREDYKSSDSGYTGSVSQRISGSFCDTGSALEYGSDLCSG